MGIRDAWRALTSKASEAGPLIAMVSGSQPQWTPRNYKAFADEGYAQNVVAYRAINEVAQSASSVPWALFRTGAGDKREQVESHPVLTLLKRPNPQQGGSEFMEAALGYFLLAGNSYIEAVGPDGRPPNELWTLRPDRMKVVPGETGMPQGYTYTISSKVKRWDVDAISGQGAILHMKKFHPTEDWYGLATIEPIAKSIDQRNEADKWNLALLQNNARPSGAITYDPKESGDNLTPEQRAATTLALDNWMAGAANAGRPIVLEGGMSWKQIAMSPSDMDFLNTKNTSSRDIALGFGVPPQLLGIPGDNTFANYREARLALWEETVMPLLQHVRDELNNWLMPQFSDAESGNGRLELGLDLNDVPALTLQRERKFEMYQQADFLTVNEKRNALGFEDTDGGDVLLVPATLLPLDEAGGDGEEPEDAEAAKKLVRLAYGA